MFSLKYSEPSVGGLNEFAFFPPNRHYAELLSASLHNIFSSQQHFQLAVRVINSYLVIDQHTVDLCSMCPTKTHDSLQDLKTNRSKQ